MDIGLRYCARFWPAYGGGVMRDTALDRYPLGKFRLRRYDGQCLAEAPDPRL